MQAYLAPVFQLLFGLGLILFLIAALRWRTPLYARGGHLMLIGLFLVPLAFSSCPAAWGRAANRPRRCC
jgi:hypothetical protein